MSVDTRDFWERVAWTFVEGAVAGWILTGGQFTKGAFIGALAAGISAVKNFIKLTK